MKRKSFEKDTTFSGLGVALGSSVVRCEKSTDKSFLTVELIRPEKIPEEAREEAIAIIIQKPCSYCKNFQVRYITTNNAVEAEFFANDQGFTMAQYQNGNNQT